MSNNAYQRELIELFTKANGDRARSESLVARIVGGLGLPPCFSLKGRPDEETRRVRELVRLIQAN